MITAATHTSSPIEWESEVTSLIFGQDKHDCLVGRVALFGDPDRELACYFDRRHQAPEKLVEVVVSTLESIDPALSAILDFVIFPYLPPDVNGFGRQLAATAYTASNTGGEECGLIQVPGTDHHADQYCRLTPAIFEHELAHLNGERSGPLTGGPPAPLLAAWQAARQADAEVHYLLPELLIHRQQALFGMARRRFLYGQEWLVDAVIEREGENEHECEREDWAEAIGYFCHDRREGIVWQAGDEQLSFQTYYPHRAAIIENWLAELAQEQQRAAELEQAD